MSQLENTTTSAVVNAYNQVGQNALNPTPYPDYIPSAGNAPTQQSYFGYTPTAPMAQVSTPNYDLSAGAYKQTAGNYQGLMGQDYDALQKALQTPGQIAAQTAYNQGMLNLNDTMGGRGLYGSSMMQNQANQGLNTVYQNTLASNAANAAAQRYGLQSSDLNNMNQFNLSREQNLNQYGMTREQALNQHNMQGLNAMINQNNNMWNANSTENARKMQYGQGQMNWNQAYQDQLRNWENQKAYEQYTYDLAKNAYSNAQKESLVNQYLSVAGYGAPLVSSANAAQNAQNALQNQQQANMAGLLTYGADKTGLLDWAGSTVGDAGSSFMNWLGGTGDTF
jgi:hypothetical protein